MIKIIEFVKRKAGLSPEEFRKYYEEVHAPLAVKHLGQYYAKYTRNYVERSIEGEVPQFDCVTEMWFNDGRAAQALLRALGGSGASNGYQTELGRVFREDEERFMDRARLTAFTVIEENSVL